MQRFFCYIGRGKKGHAKRGKPRFIFWDTTGTGYDHKQFDRFLCNIYTQNRKKTQLTLRDFITAARKAISELAPQCVKLGTNILEVVFPCGSSCEFIIKKYEDISNPENYL